MMKSQRKNLDLCQNHLFKLKQREKDEEEGDFRSRIDPKLPFNEENGRENLEKKLGPTLSCFSFIICFEEKKIQFFIKNFSIESLNT